MKGAVRILEVADDVGEICAIDEVLSDSNGAIDV